MASSRELAEQSLRFFQVAGFEAFGELAVDRRERLACLGPPPLLTPQHHLFFEDAGRPLDIPGEHVSGLPKPPAGAAIRRIDVMIRVGRDPAPAAD